jgi:flagellar biosynthesis/type III secretory pathway protein FliH
MAPNHDSQYKILFSHPELIHDLLVHFVSVIRPSWQLRRKVKDPTIPELADLVEIRNMLEERRLEWWEQWKQEGLREGRLEGKVEGRIEGKTEGRREGKREGMLEGERKGIREGEARVLHRLLERRFGRLPAWVDTRLATAAEEDLVRWSELTLDSGRSLEEVLRP